MKRVYVKYKLIFDDILRALQRDHQLRGKKKQVIQSVAFGVLAVGFFVSYLLSRDYKLGLILGIFCLGIVAVIWEMPFFSLKQAARNIEKQNAVYTLDFLDDKVLIGYGAQHFETTYTNLDFSVYEDEFQYILYPGKKRMFCLPKRKLTRELRETMNEGLAEKLGERFHPMPEADAQGEPGTKTGAAPQIGRVKEPKRRQAKPKRP